MDICPRCKQPLNGAQYCLHCHALVPQESVDAAGVQEVEGAAGAPERAEDYPAVAAAKRRVLIAAIVAAALTALGVLAFVIDSAIILLFFALVTVPFVIKFGILAFRREYKEIRNAYTDYGDVEAIFKQVSATAVYADAYFVTDGKYFISKITHHRIVRTDDVQNVYKYVYKRNLATVRKGLVFVNGYGEKIFFPCDDASAAKAVMLLKKFSPSVEIGYTKGKQFNW